MSGWRQEPFDNVIADESGGNLKTPQSEFLPSGRYAIVDQGKELVAGYTNDESRLCRSQLPVIVFGDHTRCFKYVDFPFCMGADGVKVLRPKVEADVKYLYHYLRQLRITGGGYDRHFKYLKRSSVILPPLPEQRRIAEILDRVDALRAKRRATLAQLDTLTQSIFLDMFGDPATNPGRFPRTRLDALVQEGDSINYGVVQPGDEYEDGVPLIRVGDLQNGKVEQSALKRISPSIEAAYRRSRLRGDEILISCVGSTGMIALADDSMKGFNIARAVARVPLAQSIDRTYVAHYLRTESVQRYFENELRTVSQPTLNIKQISETVILVPPLGLQREFAQRIGAVNRLRDRQYESVAGLNEAFASIQARAFRGEL